MKRWRWYHHHHGKVHHAKHHSNNFVHLGQFPFWNCMRTPYPERYFHHKICPNVCKCSTVYKSSDTQSHHHLNHPRCANCEQRFFKFQKKKVQSLDISCFQMSFTHRSLHWNPRNQGSLVSLADMVLVCRNKVLMMLIIMSNATKGIAMPW